LSSGSGTFCTTGSFIFFGGSFFVPGGAYFGCSLAKASLSARSHGTLPNTPIRAPILFSEYMF